MLPPGSNVTAVRFQHKRAIDVNVFSLLVRKVDVKILCQSLCRLKS